MFPLSTNLIILLVVMCIVVFLSLVYLTIYINDLRAEVRDLDKNRQYHAERARIEAKDTENLWILVKKVFNQTTAPVKMGTLFSHKSNPHVVYATTKVDFNLDKRKSLESGKIIFGTPHVQGTRLYLADHEENSFTDTKVFNLDEVTFQHNEGAEEK